MANLCVTGSLHGLVPNAGCPAVLFSRSESVANNQQTYAIVSARLDASGVAPSPVSFATASAAIPTSGSLFGSAFLSPSPNGNRVATGYTRSTDFGGEVLVLTDTVVSRTEAPGNYDAAWLNQTTVLVNGLGLGSENGGQGIYAWDVNTQAAVHLVTNMGTFSGAVAVTQTHVLAGGYDPSFPAASGNSLVFAIPMDAVLTALTSGMPVDAQASSTVQALTLPSDFEWTGAAAVSLDYTSFRYQAWPISESNGIFTVGTPVDFADGSTFTQVVAVDDSHALLAHADGALLVALP